ncbi:CdaR family protein [uncultured Prevotella sp.]|uniref:CdaR family protein n=1 Tax=uncultured Prevotella sp. TaxID=159272 RepID=UPI003459A82B
MTLNETYEKEIEVPVTLVEIPKNVVLTSDTTTNIRVTVRDKGYYLLAYMYSNKIHPVKIKFNNYAKKTGFGAVTSTELQKMIYQQLFNSSHITGIKPDKYEFFFNYGLKKRVPVKLNGKISLGQSYYLAKVLFSPDSIDIYARRDVLDSIKYVYTERLSIMNLTDTVIRQIPLQKTRGVKNVLDQVKISLFPDILTEEKVEVPIVAINMPEGKVLRTFPSRVTVTFTVGASIFRTIQPDKFKVIVDYNELVDSPSEKCNVYLRYIPHGVRNAKMDVSQVDYLIEEQ